VGQHFPETASPTFGALVESRGATPAPIIVERAMYLDEGTTPWAAGTNALATPQPSAIAPLTDLTRPLNFAKVTLQTSAGLTGIGPVTFGVQVSPAGLIQAGINPTTGELTLTSLAGAVGLVTVTVTATAPHYGSFERLFELAVGVVPSVSFTALQAPTPPLLPALGDFDGDGRLEYAGARNAGGGAMTALELQAIGLGPLAPLVADGRNRDLRAADFNGDGHLDLVSNVYTAASDTGATAQLFVGRGDGTFVEDPAFEALGIRGYGETILVADFDNDGDLDLFVPHYTHDSLMEQNYLLINDGSGRFVDIADPAGVAMRGWDELHKVEGAQALDFDGDGWIDFYVGSHFFFNNGNLTFTDRRAALGLPLRFEEGAKFLDWNNDGRLDLVLHTPWSGPALFEFDGQRFVERPVIAPSLFHTSYGMNIADINNDGREDIVTAGGILFDSMVLMNTPFGFRRHQPTTLDPLGNDSLAFGDLDGDGRLDIVKRQYNSRAYESTSVLNRTPRGSGGSFVIEVVGDAGQPNQHGRIVRARPLGQPDVRMTRVVDSGSGFLSQGQYPVLIGTPYPGAHLVTVAFDVRTVELVVSPGEWKRVYRTGTVVSVN
jgi:hypothetical protein